jgi:hypothetical protein
VARLRESGLDSLRVDVNSVRREYFNRFVRLNYEPVVQRLRQAARERMERAKQGIPNPEDNDDDDEQVGLFEPDDSFDKAKESLKIMKVHSLARARVCAHAVQLPAGADVALAAVEERRSEEASRRSGT